MQTAVTKICAYQSYPSKLCVKDYVKFSYFHSSIKKQRLDLTLNCIYVLPPQCLASVVNIAF